MITDAENLESCTFTYKNYDVIEAMKDSYPDAKFVLNTRKVDDLIRSRERHNANTLKPYIESWAECNGIDKKVNIGTKTSGPPVPLSTDRHAVKKPTNNRLMFEGVD